MKTTKNNMRTTMMAAMAAAYQEHQDEAAQNPAMTEQTWNDFFSPYGPAPENDDSLIEFFARRASGVAQGTRSKKTGDSGHSKE